MSQENVEIVRGAFAEFERGNFWVGDIFHPDVRIVWLDALAGGETESLGVESMAATVREWLRTWERMTMTAERITVAGDQVLVIATWRGAASRRRLRPSGDTARSGRCVTGR
jgi:ketosteroid isomerase-like protein